MNNDEIVKNLRIAFNRTVGRGSAIDAFLKLIEGGADYGVVHSAMNECGAPAPRPTGRAPATGETNKAFKDPTFTFGKFRDRKLSDVAQENPGYISWVLENNVCKSPWFADQCRMALEIYDSADGPRMRGTGPTLDEAEAQEPPLDHEDDIPF